MGTARCRTWRRRSGRPWRGSAGTLACCSGEALGRYSAINRRYWESLERGEITKPELLVRRFQDFFRGEGLAVDAEAFNAAYQSRLGTTAVPRDDSVELVRSLRGRVRQYAVSNGTVIAQTRKLRRSGLDALMDGVFLSEKLGAEKPDAAFFDAVFAAIGPVERREVMIVGDSLTSDIRGGRNAGIVTCWYSPEGGASDLPDHTIRDLREVYGFL